MTINTQSNTPVAFFYYGERFLGAAMVESSIESAFARNREYCESVDRESLPYLNYCTHATIACTELDKEVSIEPSNPLWNASNGHQACLNALSA
ncbi:conserved hypothetical protein [Vibrio crassostreae]|nr:conserved hypothetical protein [Vibrio chagasii]CAK2853898.1 conserved hypothetical protein [Vibrio crassostreae]